MQAVNPCGLLLFSWKGEFYMPQFNKRGNRIRASDKSLVFRFSTGSLLLLFLAVIMLLNLKTIITTDWKAISLFQDLYGRVGVIQIHPVFADLFHAFDTRPPVQTEETR